MKQSVQQVHTKLMSLILSSLIITGVAGVGFAAAAMAAGAPAGVGADAVAGGATEANMSDAGTANSNAQWQSGATRGADRAAARMHTTGSKMKQSGGADLEASGKAPKGKR